VSLVAVYYVDPIEGRRRKFVLEHPGDELVTHYLWVADSITSGRYRAVGLYDFREEDVASGRRGPVIPVFIAQPTGIRTIRVEEDQAVEVPVQTELIEKEAA
jgi:hypothetical protein